MTQNERSEKVTEQIKKLLALASSPNEHEARLAMQRAQELMRRYSVSIIDDPLEVIVEVPYVSKVKSVGISKVLPEICYVISKVFDCSSLYFPLLNKITIVGFKTNCLIVEHALDCILNQGIADFRQEYKMQRSLAFSEGFWVGFLDAIQRKFQQPNVEGEGLVIYDKVKEYLSKYKYGVFSAQRVNSFGAERGRVSGANVSIRPGVQPSVGGKLLG